MESSPSGQSIAECSKARAEFTREKLQTRKQCENTSSLNPEKNSSKLWNLAKVLYEEDPPRSQTVSVQNNLLIDKKAANEFAQLYRGKTPCPRHQRKWETWRTNSSRKKSRKTSPVYA